MSWCKGTNSALIGFLLALLLLLFFLVGFSKINEKLQLPQHKLSPPPPLPFGHYGSESVYDIEKDTLILIESCKESEEDDPGR